MATAVKRYESRGGKYAYVLYRDENGFTFHVSSSAHASSAEVRSVR